MLTDGKGTLAEQEASKARDKEKFAAAAAKAAQERAQLSDKRKFTDEAGNKWMYAIHTQDGTAHIFGCESNAEHLDIPATIDGSSVVALHSSAVCNMPSLTSVSVPASVKSIAKYTFKGCPNIKKFDASCDVEEYSPTWFDVSRKIEELKLPQQAVELKPNVFDLPLKKLTIGAATRKLTPGMFGRSKLEKIEISPKNTHLKTDGTGIYSKDGETFLALPRPVESYTISPNTKALAKKAFSTFSCLKKVVLPESVEVIDEFCFSRTSITEFTAPKNCREIRKSAFINCRQLKHVCLNDALEVVEDEAFAVCAISELHLPKNLKHLGNRVAISTNCTFSGEAASFTVHPECKHLKLDAQGCLYAKQGDDMVLVRYLDTSTENIEVAPGTTKIGESALFKHPNLKSVVLPDGVREIDKCAFKDCESLTHIEVPETLERIEGEAFVNTRIDGIYIPKKLEYIGPMALVSAGAFRAEDAPSIQNIKVNPENKKFYKAGSLLCEHLDGGEDAVVVRDTSDHIVKFPRSVTTVLPYALGGATDIEELYVSDNITTIHMRGFAFDCHIPKIYMHIDKAVEGHTDFFFAFPNNMRGKRQLGNAFRTMKSVNVQAVYYCYDLTITNSGSFGTYGKNDDDLYYQMKLIFERLDDPVLMSSVTRETIDKIFLFNIEELGRLFTMFSDTHAIDEIDKYGYVRENNIGLLMSGAFIACADAEHKVENARDALCVVEARLEKLEGELEEAKAALENSGSENTETGSEKDAKKTLEQAKKAVESTRARAEKRRGVLVRAEELVGKTSVVRDYVLKLALDKFEIDECEAVKLVENIKLEKEEAQRKEPMNKRRGGVAANTNGNASKTASTNTSSNAGANTSANANGGTSTSSENTAEHKKDDYHPKSAGSDPALRKAIWG